MAKYDYYDLQTALASAGNPAKGKPVGNNTRLYDAPDNGIAVRLHRTDVVIAYPDGTYRLNTGGWHTVTTKERINEWSPARLYSRGGDWRISARWPEAVRQCLGVWVTWADSFQYRFYDGMMVDGVGKPTAPLEQFVPAKGEEVVQKLKHIASEVLPLVKLLAGTERSTPAKARGKRQTLALLRDPSRKRVAQLAEHLHDSGYSLQLCHAPDDLNLPRDMLVGWMLTQDVLEAYGAIVVS